MKKRVITGDDDSIGNSQPGRLWCRSEGDRGKYGTGNK